VATRDKATPKHSACSLVAEVAADLGFAGASEKNIERIFEKYLPAFLKGLQAVTACVKGLPGLSTGDTGAA
jgi:hypothetical protein